MVQEDQDGKTVITYRGTGFIVQAGDSFLLISVSHVNFRPDQNPNQWIVLPEWIEGGACNSISIKGELFLYKPDILCIRLSKESISLFRTPPNPISLVTEEIEPLTEVYTFGFPFTEISIEVANGSTQEEQNSLIQPIFLKGYVTRRVSGATVGAGPQLTFPRNYVLDFPAYPGLSGAPLLVQEGTEMKICGMIYGNRKTQFFRGPIEVEEDLEYKIRRELYAEYDFGLACTHDPILYAIKHSADTGRPDGQQGT